MSDFWYNHNLKTYFCKKFYQVSQNANLVLFIR